MNATSPRAARAGADVRGSDLAIAAMLTTAVFAGSIFALAHSRLAHTAELPVIDPGMGIPIAVRPVADLGSGGSGDAKASDAKPHVPKAWRRKVPRAKPKQPEALPEALPIEPAPEQPEQPEQPVEDPSPVDPVPTSETGETPVEDPSAETEGPLEEGETGGEAEAPGETGDETGGESEAETEGEPGGGGGGTDPLLERAIAFYRARLVAWFSSRFRVTGSKLSPEQLAKYRVRVHIELGDDLRIDDYQILSADHPAFDKAARATLEKMRGEKLPPPPENYPGAVQHQLTVTFTCAEDTCD